MTRTLRAALDELSAALLDARADPSAGAAFPEGHSALALANHEMDRALPGRGHDERARSHLARAIRALRTGDTPPSLYEGFTGTAWVAERIAGHEIDGNESIDDALSTLLGRKRWPQTYDLLHGLVGYGVYALERMPRESASRLLVRIVDHLSAMAEVTASGVAWRSRPAWRSAKVRSRADRGFNLGIAHGVPGVIAFLGRAWRAGIARRETSRLLEGAVRWLLAQELPSRSESALATHVVAGDEPIGARAAWCYGDPGVAAALLVAADAAGERSWRRAAIRIGARAAARSMDGAGVVDAGLCHGASGLAHIFHRLHVATRDARFGSAAQAWLARTLAMREPGRGVGGFRRMRGSSDARARLVGDATLLMGSAGVALSLASFVTETTAERWAEWDRVLLLSDRA